jgi:phytol kinase
VTIVAVTVLLLAWLVVVVTAAAALRRRRLLTPEASRKAVHSSLGITAAAFPWLFGDRLGPVWALSGLALAALVALRRYPPLRQRLGAVLHDVERGSWGDLLFPLAIALCWTLAPGDPLRFSLPLLVLAVADALAALVGRGYGHLAYSSSGGHKTWEGSLAFALVTFLLAEVPLLLGSPRSRAACLLVALNLALLLTLVEALAWQGGDNLLIPLAGLLALDHWITLPVPALALHSVALLLLALACWAVRRWTTLDDAAVLACGVIAYLSWALAGGLALLAPWTVFLLYGRLYPPEAPEHGHRALIPLAVAAPAVAWLVLAGRWITADRAIVGAASVYASQLACLGLVYGRHRLRPARWGRLALGSWVLATVLVLLPTLLLGGGSVPVQPVLLATGGSLVALLAFGFTQPCGGAFPLQPGRWLRQSVLVGLGSVPLWLA